MNKSSFLLVLTMLFVFLIGFVEASWQINKNTSNVGIDYFGGDIVDYRAAYYDKIVFKVAFADFGV